MLCFKKTKNVFKRSSKNAVKLNHFYHPAELIQALNEFVENYNNNRYHEALNNLTLADVYYERSDKILKQRTIIKQTLSDFLQESAQFSLKIYRTAKNKAIHYSDRGLQYCSEYYQLLY